MSGKTIDHTAAPKAEAHASSGQASLGHFRDLTQAYQAISTRNVEKLTASISALAAVREPTEFMHLQQKFMTEAMNSAIADSAHIVKLTAAAFTAAFKPTS